MSDMQMARFKQRFSGEIIEPGDGRYDEARALYNGACDKRPRLIARCLEAADVALALELGRESGWLIAVRGGGHNGGGLGGCDDGLVIDLSLMKGVHVDATLRTVRVGPGCTQREVDRATHEHGLAVPAGIVGTTGIAGLTLGGGHGYLSRKYGLTIDNLIEAEVVLPDGSVVTANDQHQRDLFWALRGGGGNFGVVTRFSYRAQPVKEVYAGPIFWPFEAAADLMRFYRDFAPRAPRELCSFCGLKRIPTVDPFPVELRGRLTCALISCYVGSEADGQAALAPARAAMPPPWIDGMAMMPFPSLQGMFDPLMPPGLQWYWKGDFVRELPDAAIETHLRHGALIPENSLSLMHLYPIDGAVHDVASDATAWSARDVTWSMVIAGIDREPARFGTVARWAKDYWAATHPFSAGAAYLNFMMADEGQARVEATYGANYARLTALKAKYDPNNLLRVNHNIVPPAPAPSVERARELHPPP